MKGYEVELQVGELHAGDVNNITTCTNDNNNNNPTRFDHSLQEEDALVGVDEREIWLDNNQDDLLGGVNMADATANDTSIFYADFPPLSDFPCMSSSSSTSSTPAPVKSITCSSSTSSSSTSSSSAASWAVLKFDAEEAPPAALSSTASMEISHQPDHNQEEYHDVNEVVECMDAMDNFGYMDLLESNDFFDPSSIFEHDDDQNTMDQMLMPPQQVEEFEYHDHAQQVIHNKEEDQDQTMMMTIMTNSAGSEHDIMEEIMQEEGVRRGEDDDMGTVFLEWLKSNRETLSADDLRSVKLKKATIECAAKRLGGGKEAMKQLVKLVLEWVQTNHLQKRKNINTKETQTPSSNNNNNQYMQNPSPNLNSINSFPHENSISSSNPCLSPWINTSRPNYVTDPAAAMAAVPQPFPSPMAGYMRDLYANGNPNINPYHNPTQAEYHMLESAQSWPPSQFTNNMTMPSHYNAAFHESCIQPPEAAPAFNGYANPYPYPYFDGMMRLGPSATKEARKKRMARQRRHATYHRHNQNHHQSQQNHHHQQQQQQQSQSGFDHQQARLLGNDNCTSAAAAAAAGNGNLMYWPSVNGKAATASAVIPPNETSTMHHLVVDRTAMQTNNNNYTGRVSSSDRNKQGWKPEKNLRFLLQKVLKQSDVGSLGRIVLPKKEAETHLPELEARDGISIAMEDIGTSRVWNMRYRYWPNNKSRMYLLENTGDFVRANELQEGDFIVIYSDVKCGKYMIRGVKVRQPGPKIETKRPGKAHKNQRSNSPAAGGANNNNNSISLLPSPMAISAQLHKKQ